MYAWLRTCIKTECVISGTTGGLLDPNHCYKISWSLTRLIIKLTGQTYKCTFSAVDDISLYYIVSLCMAICYSSRRVCTYPWRSYLLLVLLIERLFTVGDLSDNLRCGKGLVLWVQRTVQHYFININSNIMHSTSTVCYYKKMRRKSQI